MNDNSPPERYEIRTVTQERPSRFPANEGMFYVHDAGRAIGDRRISLYFQTRAQAERCRDVLIADDRRRLALLA